MKQTIRELNLNRKVHVHMSELDLNIGKRINNFYKKNLPIHFFICSYNFPNTLHDKT